MADVPSNESSGELVFFGSTDWALMGKQEKKRKNEEMERREIKFPSLFGPHRLSGLVGVKIRYVAAGCGEMTGSCFVPLTSFASQDAVEVYVVNLL